MERPNQDQVNLLVAYAVALRGTCQRRRVGAVLVDKNYHILSTGYNGTTRGRKHCTDEPCPGVGYPSGVGLDLCEAIHAEQNALLQCPSVNKIFICYSTTMPCIHCVKLLLNTPCETIVYAEDYQNPGIEMWHDAGRNIAQVSMNYGVVSMKSSFLKDTTWQACFTGGLSC
jgi:dCMP deaminase